MTMSTSFTTTVIFFARTIPMLRKHLSRAVQDLNSRDHKFAYVVWKLSDDGQSLRLRNVNDKVVPKETKDSAALVALLTKNARNPELFGEEIEFRKEK